MATEPATPPVTTSALGSMPSDPAPVDPATAGAPPPVDPAAASISFPDNWKDGIPEEFRKDASLESIKSVQDLAKGYVHAQKMIGKDKVTVPDPKFATDADWAAFYQKVGMPKDAKDYAIKAPKGDVLDEQFLGEFKEAAHKMNIPPGQAQKLLDWYAEKEVAAATQARDSALADVQAKLDQYKTSVGAAWEKKVLLANRTLEKFGGQDAQKWMAENPAVGSNPLMIEMLSKLGDHLYGEDKFEGSDRVQGAMTPKDASEKINEVMGDQNHPYFQELHPKHKDAVEYMRKLFTMANP